MKCFLSAETSERGSTAGYLSLSYRRWASGPPSLHFLVNRLHGNHSATRLCPRPLGKATSARLMFQSERRAADADAETNVFPLISRMARIDFFFCGHTGESHFRLGLIRHFNSLQLSSTNSKKKKVIDFCIINNSGDYD